MTNVPHLHLHSYYSTLDGVPSPEQYFKACEEKNIPAIAFTEHGNMGSHAQASIEARKYKVKVILGMEMYVSPSIDKINLAKFIVSGKAGGKKIEKAKDFLAKNRSSLHAVLLAKNEEGYKNLTVLNNFSWTEGFYYRNRVDFERIRECNEGLICLSACMGGIVSKFLLLEEYEKARKVALFFKKTFPNRFYLELQFLDIEKQDILNKKLVELGTHLNIPFVITNDVHYIENKDHELQDILFGLFRTNKRNSDEEEQRDKVTVNYLKTLEDFERDFKEHKSVPRKIFVNAIDNVFKVAEQCDYVVPLGGLFFPSFDHKKHLLYREFPYEDKEKFFMKMLFKRAKKILGPLFKNPEYKERLIYEFLTLRKLGGIDYFLIVDDLLAYVKREGAFSLIRGSANGSLIAFAFGFGLIDPIKHKIMFERFISKYRSLNDIDIDIDVRSEFRSKAVEYLRKKYGDERVFSIGTYSRMQLKTAIKDVTRVLKIRLDKALDSASSEEEKNKISRQINSFSFSEVNKVTSKMEGDLTIDQARNVYADFDHWYKLNKGVIEKYISPLIGSIRNISLHPAGVVIVPEEFETLLPIRSQNEPGNSGERIVATAWENSHTGREDLNEIGVMTLDILGVRTLSVVSEVIELVKKTRGVKIDLYNLNLDDKKTLSVFNQAELVGVFQFSGGAASQIVKNTKITEFNDLIVINALARPGALQAGADKSFSRRKEDPSLIEYDHHSLKNILNDSNGVLVFSEHILRTASEFAGMHPKKADALRKIIKGKNPEIFKAYEKEFIKGAVEKWKKEKDIEKRARIIWEKFSQAGSYLFPRGHASSYALLGYICQYLKVHYPIEFFNCYLRFLDHDKYAEAKEVAEGVYGIEFELPSVDNFCETFTIKNGKIVWPISALMNIGEAASAEFVNKVPYSSFDDVYNKVSKGKCTVKSFCNLIDCKVFEKFGDRLSIMHRYYELRKETKKSKEDKPPSGYYFSKGEINEGIVDNRVEEIFGFEISSIKSLFKKQLHKYKNLVSEEVLNDSVGGESVIVFGKVVKRNEISTKNGDQMAFISLKNGREMIEITLFPDALTAVGFKLVKGNVVVVSGIKNSYRGKSSVVVQIDRSTRGLAKGSWVHVL